MKRDGTASDHLREQAVATPQDESVTGERSAPESIPPESLLARVLERANLQRALKQVRQNKGAPGIDGMTVDALPEFLKHHWLEIRAKLIAGTYRPQAVRRVEIPKPDGKMRPLGIPTVLDRFIQQAIAQVIQAQWEPHFHPHSYGFRPQRSAHQAVCELQAKIHQGYRQMDTTQVTLLYLEAMGPSRLSGIAQTRCVCARSMEHQQVSARTVAALDDPSACTGVADAVLSQFRSTDLSGAVGIFIEPPYVIRTHGGVGGRGREASSYPD